MLTLLNAQAHLCAIYHYFPQVTKPVGIKLGVQHEVVVGLVLQELAVQVPGVLAGEDSGESSLPHELLLCLTDQSGEKSEYKAGLSEQITSRDNQPTRIGAIVGIVFFCVLIQVLVYYEIYLQELFSPKIFIR